jgi:hypothetical protein
MFAISLILIIVGVAVIAFGVFAAMRRSAGVGVPVVPRRTVAAPPPQPEPFNVVEDPPAVEEIALDNDVEEIVPAVVPITPAAPVPMWPQRVQPDAGALDDEARLRLINDLGLLRAAWCLPILEEACVQETDPALHDAAVAALARCRRPSRSVREVAR